MKKSALAIAALLSVTAGVASAQSSVTLYGVVDASIENVKGTSSVTRVSSDNFASSRLGFRGVEDLGGGLKAKFVLESGLKVDTGVAGSSDKFWSRGAWVGLEGSFGEVRLGRTDTPMGAIVGNTNILGGQAYDDFAIANTFANGTYRRVDNSITYILPKLVQGLTLQGQYSVRASGNEASGDDQGKGFSLAAQYADGPLALGAAYLEFKANAAGSYENSAAVAYASYDFGMAKLTGYYNVDSRSTLAEQKRLLGARVLVPVTTDFSVQAGLSKVYNSAKSAADDDALILAVKLNYNLSKRTGVYGLLTTVDNDSASSLGVAGVATAAGKNSHGLAVGVRHAF